MAASRSCKAQSVAMGKRNGGRTEPDKAVRHRVADGPCLAVPPLSWPPSAGFPRSPGAPRAARPGLRARTPIPGSVPRAPIARRRTWPARAAALALLLPWPALAATATPVASALAWAGAGAITGVLATLAWLAWRRSARPAPDPLPDATALLEALPCAAFIKDGDGRYLAVNRAFELHYGCQRREVIGRTLAEARSVHGADTEALLQAENHFHQTGEPVACEIGHNACDATRTLRLRLHPVPGSGGMRAVLGTMADVTELHQARRATEAATHTAGTFLSLMSHEIRTPIAGALGLVELLGHTPLDPEQVHMLGMLEESVEGLLEILGDILDFSRLQAGELQLDSEVFDLRALVDEVVDAAAGPARENGLQLFACLDHQLAAGYRGDAARLRQILSHLLACALRASGAGHVEVRAEVTGGGEGRQALRLSVADSHAGSEPPATLARTVEPQPGDTARPGGLALGLAICRYLVRLMHGELVLSRVAGEGGVACFELSLPVERELQPVPGLEGRVALACTRDPRTGHALAEALAALGLQPVEAVPSGVGELAAGDADLFVVDASLLRAGRVPAAARAICLLDPADPLPPPEGCIVLPVTPLLWRNVLRACRAALDLHAPEATGLLQIRRHAARILVAEDHPINRAVISRQLQRLGYPHEVACNGEEALQLLQAGRYDLLVTDCHMPVLDGYALVRRIRAAELEGNAARLPVIALSASVLPGHVRHCFDAGMDDFLAKPVQLHDLELKLARHLGEAPPPVAAGPPDPAAGTGAYRQLALLMEAFGSLRQVREVLHGLLATCREDLAALDQAIVRGDTCTQHELLHRIAGSLRLVGEPPGGAHDADTPSARRDALLGQVHWLGQLLHSLGPPDTPADAGTHAARTPTMEGPSQ